MNKPHVVENARNVGWAKRSVPIIPTTPIHPKNPPCHYEHYAVTHLLGTGDAHLMGTVR